MHLHRPALRGDRDAGAAPRRRGSARPSRRWRPSTIPTCRPGSSGRAARSGSASSGCARRAASCSPRSAHGTTVGLVGDRDLTGGGTLVDAVRRAGPAAARAGDARGRERCAGATSWASRRVGVGRYRGRLERVVVPADGTRRERVTGDDGGARERVRAGHRGRAGAVVGGLLPDLARPRGRRRVDAEPTSRPRRRPASPERTRERRLEREPAPIARVRAADLHIHTVASDGTADIPSILEHVGGRRTTSTCIAITDHERIDAAVAARAMAPDRGLRDRGRRRRGGHDAAAATCSRCSSSDRIRPYRSLRVDDRGGPRRRAASPSRPIPLVPYPLCAQGWMLRRLLDDRDAAVHPDAIEAFNPTTLGRPWHDASCGSPTVHGLAADRQQRRPRPRRDRQSAGPRSRADRPTTCGARIEAGQTEAPRRVPRHGRPARRVRPSSSASAARDARDEVRRPARGRRRAPGPRPRLPRRPPAGRRTPTAASERPADRARRRREDRPRLPVHLPGGRRRRPARPVPLREPAAARPRRPHHHRQPRPPALVRGRHHPPRRRLLDADQRLGRDADVLAALHQPGRARCSSASSSTSSTSTSRSCRSCRSSCCASRTSVNVATFHAYAGFSPSYEFGSRAHARPRAPAPRPHRGQRGGPPLHRPLLPGRLQGHPQRRRHRPLRQRGPARALAGRDAEPAVRRAARAAQGPPRPAEGAPHPAQDRLRHAPPGRRLRAAGARGAPLRGHARPPGRRVPGARQRRREGPALPDGATSSSRRRPAANRSGSCSSRRWPPGRRSSARTSTATRASSAAAARACWCRRASPRSWPTAIARAARRPGLRARDERGRARARRGVQLAAGHGQGRGVLRLRHPPARGRRAAARPGSTRRSLRRRRVRARLSRRRPRRRAAARRQRRAARPRPSRRPPGRSRPWPAQEHASGRREERRSACSRSILLTGNWKAYR